MKDWKLVIAFDVDDTLLTPRIVTPWDYETPHYENIQAYKWFQKQGCHMIVWSGSWTDWARTWSDKFWLFPDEIRVKQKSDDVDICIDDCNVDLATINLKVKRINNQISRKEWNETKR